MGDRWAAVEIMGHRQHVGRISEEPLAGVSLLRVDVLQRDGTFETIRYGGPSIFSIRDVSEERAREEVMRPSAWGACSSFVEQSAIAGRCGNCGHDVPAHEEAKARATARQLPVHEDDEPPASDDLPI